MTEQTRTKSTSPLSTILISLILGGLSGGLVASSVAMKAPVAVTTNKTSTLSVQEDSATVDVVKNVSPAVVSIIISKDYSKIYGQQSQPQSPLDNLFGFPFNLTQPQQPQGKQEIGGGSGFIVRADGLIVTNKHVVDDDQAEYTVVMNDGKRYDAKVLAKDPSNDVAVIKVEAKDLPTVTFGDSDVVDIGQTVIAIGNALGQYRNTVTKGVVSGKSRTITAGDSNGQSETLEDVFQTDAAINPGNSGGPLINLAGQVIAINTAVNQQGQLIGFAIPANVVKKDVTSVDTTGKIVRPYIGIRYILITKALAEKNKLPVDHGALVQRGATVDDLAVIPGGPADKAGIVENDIIVSVNGKEIDADHSLTGLLAQFNPGEVVMLKLYHKGETTEVKVTLEERK